MKTSVLQDLWDKNRWKFFWKIHQRLKEDKIQLSLSFVVVVLRLQSRIKSCQFERFKLAILFQWRNNSENLFQKRSVLVVTLVFERWKSFQSLKASEACFVMFLMVIQIVYKKKKGLKNCFWTVKNRLLKNQIFYISINDHLKASFIFQRQDWKLLSFFLSVYSIMILKINASFL